MLKLDPSMLFASEEVQTLPPVVNRSLPEPLVSTTLPGTLVPHSGKRRPKGSTKASMARMEFLKKKVNAGMTRDRGNMSITMTQGEYLMHLATASSTAQSSLKHDFIGRHKTMPYTGNTSFNRSTVKYDVKHMTDGKDSKAQAFMNTIYDSPNVPVTSSGPANHLTTVNLSDSSSIPPPSTTTTHLSQQTEMLRESKNSANPIQAEIEQIRGYLDMLDQYSLHNFIVWKGSCVTNTPEFASFKRKYNSYWGSILVVLSLIEKLMIRFTVPLAVVDGSKVAELSACDAEVIEDIDLLECVSNIEQIMPIINSKGRGLGNLIKKGTREHALNSAVRIQSWVRMKLTVKWFKREILRRRAATMIQTSWRKFSSMWRVREMLRVKNLERDVLWEKMLEKFR